MENEFLSLLLNTSARKIAYEKVGLYIIGKANALPSTKEQACIE